MAMEVGPQSTTNDTYGNYTEFSSTHLPEPPRRLKNRYIDNERQRLGTSNDAYGRYWSGTARSSSDINDGDRPAGLDSHSIRRDEPTTKRIQQKMHHSNESDTFWNDAAHPMVGPAGSASSYVDRPEYPWNAGRQNGYDGQGMSFAEENDWGNGTNMSRRKPLPPINSSLSSQVLPTYRGSSTAPEDEATSGRSRGLGELEKFVRQYRVTVGMNGGGDSSNIRNIDLHFRLHDNSTVTVRSVPFSFE